MGAGEKTGGDPGTALSDGEETGLGADAGFSAFTPGVGAGEKAGGDPGTALSDGEETGLGADAGFSAFTPGVGDGEKAGVDPGTALSDGEEAGLGAGVGLGLARISSRRFMTWSKLQSGTRYTHCSSFFSSSKRCRSADSIAL